MREYTITTRQVFMISVRLLARFFIIFLLVITGIFFWYSIREHGVWVLAHPEFWIGPYFDYVWTLIPLFGAACIFMYRMANRQKAVGIPVRYGFDETGVYMHDAYGSVMYTWEYFISRRETGDFFLLHDGARQILWPKDIWNISELETQRGLMARKISPKAVRPQ